jgi:hypothetical protein
VAVRNIEHNDCLENDLRPANGQQPLIYCHRGMPNHHPRRCIARLVRVFMPACAIRLLFRGSRTSYLKEDAGKPQLVSFPKAMLPAQGFGCFNTASHGIDCRHSGVYIAWPHFQHRLRSFEARKYTHESIDGFRCACMHTHTYPQIIHIHSIFQCRIQTRCMIPRDNRIPAFPLHESSQKLLKFNSDL